jgi:hypothetical protein
MSKIEDIRDKLKSIVPIKKRGANLHLYRALVATMQICEICQSDEKELVVLNLRLNELSPLPGHNRIYVEKKSDLYQRVSRFVFYGDEHTANINRYAIAVRRAHQQGIKSDMFFDDLNKGGVNKYFITRPLSNHFISTKCIRLDSPITHEKQKEITLRLVRLPENVYKVLSIE